MVTYASSYTHGMRALAGIALSATFLTAVAFIEPTVNSIDKDGLPAPLIQRPYNYANPNLPAHYLTADLWANCPFVASKFSSS